MVVAGGGGGGGNKGGGSGAGGYRFSKCSCNIPYTASPDRPDLAPNRITVTATGFPITVGGGGTGIAPGPTGPGAAGTAGNLIQFFQQ